MPSAFGSPAAARVGDPITHSAALSGLLEGVLIGAALGAILVASGGTAAPLLIAGAAATGGSIGGAVGKFWGEHHVTPCGTVLTGSPNVNVNDRPAAFAGSLIACSQHPGPQMVAEGSAMVNINGRPAAREGDHGTCGCRIAAGSPNVFIGGASVSPVGYAGEVPWYADAALCVLGLAGGGALMAIKGLGAAAIALKLGGQFFGGELGAAGGHALGGRLFGEGTQGQTILQFGGALVGGLGGEGIGGFGASRAARAAQQAATREAILANLEASRAARLGPEANALGNAAAVERTATVPVNGVPGPIDYSYGFESDLVNFNEGYTLHSGPLEHDLVLTNFHNADAAIGRPGRSLIWWTPAEDANGLGTVGEVKDHLALPDVWGPRNGVAVARIPAGTEVTFYRGTAAEQSVRDEVTGLRQIVPGGGTQYRFRAFDPSWIVDSRRIP